MPVICTIAYAIEGVSNVCKLSGKQNGRKVGLKRESEGERERERERERQRQTERDRDRENEPNTETTGKCYILLGHGYLFTSLALLF